MNRRTFSILTAVSAAAFALCGCGPTENKLVLKIEAGDQYKLHIVSIMDVDMTIKELGMSTSQTIEEDSNVSFDVVSKGENGDYSLKLTQDSVKLNMEVSVGQMGGGAGDRDEMLKALENVLTHKSVTLKLSPSGRVQDLDGHLDIQDAIVEVQKKGMKEVYPAGSPMEAFGREPHLREQARMSYGLPGYDYLISQVVMPRPTEPIKVGGSWQCKLTIPVDVPLVSDTTYTLKSLEGDKAVVEVAGTIGVNPDKAEVFAGGMAMKYDLAGTSKGTITLDNASGFVTSASFQVTLTGEITMSGGMMPGSITMPINIQLTTTVESA